MPQMKGDAFVVYEQEPPYKPRFVARRYILVRGGELSGPHEPMYLGDTLVEVRKQIPDRYYPQLAGGKDREDLLAFRNGARIIETWL